MEQEDFFNSLVCLCAEVNRTRTSLALFQARACRYIHAKLEEIKKENSTLYNPFKNLYLDKCYGESQAPLGAWIDLSDYIDI